MSGIQSNIPPQVPRFEPCPIRTEVHTMNECRRTFRQIKQCLRFQTAPEEAGETLTAHDHTGGLTLDGTPKTVPLDTLDTDTGDLFTFDPATSTVTVEQDAAVGFTFRASMTSPGFACVMVWLEEDMGGGTGFQEVDGTRAFMWIGTPPL